ncbi:hypothetical protein D3C71_1508080 [compost metagenome]
MPPSRLICTYSPSDSVAPSEPCRVREVSWVTKSLLLSPVSSLMLSMVTVLLASGTTVSMVTTWLVVALMLPASSITRS